MVCEGDMGNIMLENKEYRNDTFNNASMVEVKLNTPILTSLLKGQYGKSDDKNTPSCGRKGSLNQRINEWRGCL